MEWKVDKVFYHPEYNSWLTMILSEEKVGDDNLCIASVYGRTEEECLLNAYDIVNNHNVLNQINLRNERTK